MHGKLNDSIDDISSRLQMIGYQVERIQNQALLLPPDRTEPDLGVLESRLENEWRLLCSRAGFDTPAEQPPLPSNPRKLLLSSAHVYQEMVMAHTRDTLLTPRKQYLSVSPIPSPELIPLQPRVAEQTETHDASHMLDSITLGEPGRAGNRQNGDAVEASYTAEMYAANADRLLLTSPGS
jgi:hypothetical protein